MPIQYSKYPKNWKTEIVPVIRKRSGGKCEVCGVENYSVGYWENESFYILSSPPHDVPWMEGESEYKQARDIQKHLADWADITESKPIVIVLTVAHLDHDEGNHNVKLDRLKDMCQRCHNRYDRKHRNQTRKSKKFKGQKTLKL